jgi:hypothetical protein
MKHVIVRLRELAPTEPLDLDEDLKLAERQANLLLAMSGVSEPTVPEQIIQRLPRLVIHEVSFLPHSAEIRFVNGIWLMVLNGSEPLVWRRSTAMHEFKHILDNAEAEVASHGLDGYVMTRRSEPAADAFAACVLMPRVWVERVWGEGVQEIALLARIFGVSFDAMRQRLERLGLIPRRRRHPEEILV